MNTYKLLYSHTRTDDAGRKMDEEMEKVSSVKPHNRLRGHLITVIFAIMTIIFITLLVLVPVLYVQLSEDYNNQFGVVFSVESNHSHMIIFRWDGRKRYDDSHGVTVTTDTGVVQSVHQCYMPYGVILFAANISLVEATLQECLNQATCSDDNHHDDQCVSSDRKDTTKAYLGATDSMRLLHARNHSVADKILKHARETIKKTFPQHDKSTILSNKEEDKATIVGWNEMKGTLPPREDHQQLYGVISMGELSSHIVLREHFVVNDSTAGDDHMRHLSLYYNNYTVYSKVDHCYGWNESLRMLSANLTLSYPATPTIDQPCLPQGYTWNITAGELFIDPCTNWINPYSNRDHVISFTGTANSSSCAKTVKNKLLYNFPRLTINSSYNLTTVFAFSYYYEVMKFFNITDVYDDHTGWSMMERSVMSFCNLSWHQMVSSYGDIDERLLFRLCYDGTLVYTLLQYNGFVPTSSDHGVWSIHREQYEVPWLRGMMVEKTRNIEADPLEDRPFSDTVLVIGLLTFALFTILFLFLLTCTLNNVCRRSKHRNSKNGYIQISHD